MKYFSMFTGVGGFELGLEDHHLVGYSEIDKYSNMVMKKHFGGVKNYGNAREINTGELPEFDMLCGGFPCQAFSIAGHRRGFGDTRGTLFFEIARVLKAKRPKTVLLENVKGLLNHEKGQTFRTIIQTLWELGYDIEWVVLNSKYFGVPQNRERVFIIGSLRGTSRPEVLPLRQDANEVQGLSEKEKFRISNASPREMKFQDYCPTMLSRDYKGPKVVMMGLVPTINATKEPIIYPCYTFKSFDGSSKEHGRAIRQHKEDGSPCLSSQMGTGGNNVPMVINYQPVPVISKKNESYSLDTNYCRQVVALRGRNPDNPTSRVSGLPTEQRFEPNMQDTSNTLTNIQKDNLVWDGYNKQVYKEKDTVGSIRTNQGCGTTGCSVYQDKLRRLTPVECERLQGFPDNWTKYGINEQGETVQVSDTQRYKMMGNAVTTKVIKALNRRIT